MHRSDPWAVVVGISTWILPNGAVSTRWDCKCPLCGNLFRHYPARANSNHLPRAHCTPHSGIHIMPPSQKVIDNRHVTDQRPEADQRAAYIAACRDTAR